MAIDLIKEYEKRGWVIHPLTGPKDTGNSPGKKPLLKGWQLLTKTPADIRKYIDQGYNIGLVCGINSNVTVIDLDSFLFYDVIAHHLKAPLMNQRVGGRGHLYFEYEIDLKSQKHPLLGIEILNDGSNAVLPSSIHASGDIYRWNEPMRLPPAMPRELITSINVLFRTETELKQALTKARPCFSDSLKNKPTVHGSDGRQYMVAICAELMAVGASEDHLNMFCKIMYDKKYNEAITNTELSNIDPRKTWRCATLKEKLPGYVKNYCKDCRSHAQPKQEIRVIPENVRDYFRTVSPGVKAIILVIDEGLTRS